MLIDNPPILTITIFGTGKILSPVYGLSSRRDSPETSVTPSGFLNIPWPGSG